MISRNQKKDNLACRFLVKSSLFNDLQATHGHFLMNSDEEKVSSDLMSNTPVNVLDFADLHCPRVSS